MTEHAIIDQAIEQYSITKVFGLFSGGHDSLCATHVASSQPCLHHWRIEPMMTPRQHLIRDLDASLAPHATWFTAQLFRLIAKADPNNLHSLWMGFPKEVSLWQEYQATGQLLFEEFAQQSDINEEVPA